MFDKSEFLPGTLPDFMICYAKHDMISDWYMLHSEDIERYKNHIENCVEFANKYVHSSLIVESSEKKNILDIFSQRRDPIVAVVGESFLKKYDYIAVFYNTEDSYNLAPHLCKNVKLHRIELVPDDQYGYHIRLVISKDSLMINDDEPTRNTLQ